MLRSSRIGNQDTDESSASLVLGSSLLDADLSRDTVLSVVGSTDGLFLRDLSIKTAVTHDVQSLDTELATRIWGKRIVIDYQGADGRPLKGAVILPPGYQPGTRYPTLVWVYEGYHFENLDTEYFTDPRTPGVYNLQSYAAQGYVILVPSMPLPQVTQRGDVIDHVEDGLMPAVDKLVNLGIADPEKLGLMGQSYGGYSVYAIVTRTNRFKAAVAMAGISDLTSFATDFDPTARGYPGIDHEKSINWDIIDQFGRHTLPPAMRRAIGTIRRSTELTGSRHRCS